MPRRGGTIRIYIRGVDTKPDGNLHTIEHGSMYSRSVSVIGRNESQRLLFRVPPYTSGLHMPPSEVFLSFVWTHYIL